MFSETLASSRASATSVRSYMAFGITSLAPRQLLIYAAAGQLAVASKCPPSSSRPIRPGGRRR